MDSFTRVQRNAFVAHTIDRVHSLRWDEAWLEQSRLDAATRFVVVWQDQVLVEDGAAPHVRRLSADEVQALHSQCPETPIDVVLLGKVGEVTYFGVGIGEGCAPLEKGSCPVGHFLDLRGVAAQLGAEEGALAAQAKAMIHWHRQHRFCGRCGSPTQSEEGGYLLRCANEACGQVHFPRVDPAIIVLVTSGDHCLLGRQPSWPQGRYSNIAGFVEPGESLETAVAREVWEETGIEIRSIQYHSSQPWPFPQSLMVGFTAAAGTTDIQRHDGELEDARWFTREAIAAGLQSGTLGLPSLYSISFRLIEDWFDAGDCGVLQSLISTKRT